MALQTNLMGASQQLHLDTRRNDKYRPGRLVTSVKLDQSALECFYCWATCPFCCCKEELAKATYMDVYTNSVEIGKPLFMCCCTCSRTAIGVREHFDDPVVFNGTAMKGDICSPAPFCCVNKCDCCGEALVLRGSCCTGTRFFGLGNQYTTPSWCPLIACCMPITVMYGLAPGEASRVASIINDNVANFRNGRWNTEAQVEAVVNGSMGHANIQHVVHHVVQQPAIVYQQPPMGEAPMAMAVPEKEYAEV